MGESQNNEPLSKEKNTSEKSEVDEDKKVKVLDEESHENSMEFEGIYKFMKYLLTVSLIIFL